MFVKYFKKVCFCERGDSSLKGKHIIGIVDKTVIVHVGSPMPSDNKTTISIEVFKINEKNVFLKHLKSFPNLNKMF